MTLPPSPCGTLRLVSRTSRAFSLKMARMSFSSAVSSVSPFGVTLPTRRSPELTSAPMRTMPRSSRSLSDSSERFGMSRVISSSPSLVVRASTSYSSMWIEERRSFFTTFSLRMMASSKLKPSQLMKRDQEVAAERELAAVGRRAVGQHGALRHLVAGEHDRLLVDQRALVGAHELDQVVGVDVALAGVDLDVVGVDVGDLAAALGDDHVAGVHGGPVLHAGADVRRLGVEQRHGLALHVGAHEGAVGVVVLEERDEGRGHRDELGRADVHVVDVGRRHLDDVGAGTRAREDQVVLELAGLGCRTAALAWAMVTQRISPVLGSTISSSSSEASR